MIARELTKNSNITKLYSSSAYSSIFMLPSVVLNTSLWSQVVWAGVLLIGLYFLIRDKYWAFFLFIGFSLSIKQTAIMILPTLCVIYLLNKRISVLHTLNILVGYLIASIPALIFGGGKKIKDIWIPVFINFVSLFNILNYLHGVSDAVSNTRIKMVQIVSIVFLLTSIYFVYYVLKYCLGVKPKIKSLKDTA